MRRGLIAFFVFALVLISLPVLADRETGSIEGTVRSDDGQPLPGVNVTAASPALIGGKATATTDSEGNYRFGAVPPGNYEITTEISGFQTVTRTGIRVFVGSTATVDATLKVQTSAEIIEVSGDVPEVDVTSAQSSHTIPTEEVENLPKIGFALDLFTLAPGVGADNVAYGGGGSSANAYWLDGVDVSDPNISTTWVFPNYNWIQEVNVVGLGAPAEYGGFTGVVANTVTKSGSNNFHGLAEFFFQNDSLTSTNTGGLTPEQQDLLNPPTVDRFNDATLQIGGPITKDKLWFFGSYQYFHREDIPLGADVAVTDSEPRAFGKLTYKANENNTVQGFIEWDRYNIDGRGISSLVPFESTFQEKADNYTWNASVISILNPNTNLDVRYSGFTGYFDLTPQNGQIPGHVNLNTGFSSANAAFTSLNDRSRHQVNAAVSHYASNFIKGDHDFKFGAEVERSTTKIDGYYNGGFYYLDYTGPGYYYYYTGNFLRLGGNAITIDSAIHRVSAFAQDSWNFNDKLRFDVGFRWDHNRGTLKNQGTPFKTDPIAPRLGVIFDVKGDHKTILKAHYGHYYEATITSYFDLLVPATNRTLELFIPPINDWFLLFSQSGANYSIADDLKHPYVQQFTVGVDRELPWGINFGGHYIYRKWKNIIEDVNVTGQFVPVVITNPITGEPLTVFNQTNPGENEFIMTNVDASTCSFCFVPEKHYNGLEFYANKRVSDKLYLNGSFVWSEARGTYDNRNNSTATGGNNLGTSNLFDDPNFGINVDGKLTNDPTYEVKIQGIYNWAYGINTSLQLRTASGDNFTQLIQLTQLDQGVTNVFGVPRGSDRNPTVTTVDIRLEKEFPVSAGQLRFTADIFNLFNSGYTLTVNNVFGQGTFLQPLTYTFPREIRLGARYSF